MSATAAATFWLDYYRKVHDGPSGWLDYSNDRVQAQGFGLAIEALGPVAGKRCLDVGAGRGQLARMLAAQGAASVTAIELVPETIAELRRDAPGVDWRAGDAGDSASYAGLERFDAIGALEVLQYVPFAPTIQTLFALLRPGGRLVGIIPNRDCPLVQRPIERFGGKFGAVSATEIASVLGALPGLSF